MNTTRMPGFSAEASFYRSSAHYQAGAMLAALTQGEVLIHPAVPRNSCQDYLNQARTNNALATWWRDYAQVLVDIDWTSQVADAVDNANVFRGFADAYLSEYDLECR